MSRIGPTLEPGHQVIIFGEIIYYLALAFIAPLEAE
jgi:hypothetical protein